MAHLTGNFTSEAPLAPEIQEALQAAFDQGWADPKKASQASGRARNLRAAALEEISAHLATTPDRLEVIGEPSLLPYLSLMGFAHGESALFSSTADVGKIRAIARSLSDESHVMGIDLDGRLLSSGMKFPKGSVISIQATNGETGAVQDLEKWRNHSSRVVLDATRSLPHGRWVEGFAATTFEATSWNGPSGIGFLHIEDAKNFRYPLPHLAPIRVPGSYSLPLLMVSALALSTFTTHVEEVIAVRMKLASELSRISGVTVLAEKSGASSRYLSILIEEFSSEEVLRSLLNRNISIDAGSACSPEDIAPSHVIASMGFPTQGHLRFTVHPGHRDEDVEAAARGLSEVLLDLRS